MSEVTRRVPRPASTADTLGSVPPVEFWEQSPGEVLGHFRLLAPLGAGGFGRVWQALDLKLEREVAIKVLAMELSRKPGSRALLETEARTVARLKHPGIVTLHALEEVDGHLLLVMERIEGTTLEGLIPPQGMPLDQLLDLSLQMCEALGAAHGQGIIHRDLNPRNLMVTGEGRVKILDFGLALHQAATQPLPVQGRSPGASDGLTGTLPYLAPEQLEGRLLDARSDLFSLGVVLYEMATGSRPFHASSMVEQIKATLRTEPLWPPTLPSGWTAVLKRCLDKDPDQRFASCQELHHALKQVAARPPEAATAMAVDLEAYEDYLRGRQYYARYNRHGMRFAMQMFQQALDREPRFAAAWAGIANCAAFLYIYADRSEANRAQADAASTRALELDPTLAEAHASRGVALSAAGQMEAAEAAFLEALRLDPNLYEGAYFYARHCLATGQLACAAASFEAAARCRPADCQAILLVAQVYTDLGRPDDAEAARRAGLALVEERLRHTPDDVRARYLGANALIALGETQKGLAWARLARGLDPDDPMLLYNLGCIHALAGEGEDALDCLTAAVRAGLTQRGWFLHDGDLASIRTRPRFQALLAQLP